MKRGLALSILAIVAIGLSIGVLTSRPLRASEPECLDCLAPSSTLVFEELPGLTVYTLSAGSSYHFSSAEAEAGVEQGSWRAQYGSVTADGLYTAPTFRLPYGEDTLSYRTLDGQDAKLTLNIEANPAIPSSTKARWLTKVGANANGVPIYVVRNEGAADGAQGTLEQLQTQGLAGLPIFEPTVIPPPNPGVRNCVLLQTSVVTSFVIDADPNQGPLEGPALLVDPVTGGGNPTPSQPARKCKRRPVNGDKTGQNCNTLWQHSNGTYVFCGPLMTEFIPPVIQSSGQIKVGAQVDADIIMQQWGASVAVNGEYPLTRAIKTLKQKQKCDIYRCVDGKLVYIGSSDCFRVSLEYTNSPAWTIYLDYGVFNNPHTVHGTWYCTFYGTN